MWGFLGTTAGFYTGFGSGFGLPKFARRVGSLGGMVAFSLSLASLAACASLLTLVRVLLMRSD
jgi:hypothetical protein